MSCDFLLQITFLLCYYFFMNFNEIAANIGDLQRAYKVVLTTCQLSGDIVWEEWYNEDGLRHRPNGPASTLYNLDNNDKPSRQEWFKNGILHRPIENGPAVIEYDDDGNVVLEKYIEDGCVSRIVDLRADTKEAEQHDMNSGPS